MSKKALSIWFLWFALVAGLGGVFAAPLSWWQLYLQPYVPNQIKLNQLQGHWWDGQATLNMPNLSGEVAVGWQLTSIFSPVSWRALHPKFQLFGNAQLDVEKAQFWVTQASIDADTFNGLMRRQGVQISGTPYQIKRFYVVWPWQAPSPTAFRGTGVWRQGLIQYPMGRVRKEADIQNWQLQGRLSDGLPELVILAESGDALGSGKWVASQELEIAVMPTMIEALGQRWNGSREYPAFMMVEPLPWLKL